MLLVVKLGLTQEQDIILMMTKLTIGLYTPIQMIALGLIIMVQAEMKLSLTLLVMLELVIQVQTML